MGVPVICFVPCCSKKEERGGTATRPYQWPPAELCTTWAKLEAARAGMAHCVDQGSKPTPALNLYAGNFYSVPMLKETAVRLIRSGTLRLFVISAGYGVLDALEPAKNYDAKMEGPVAAYWRSQGLVDIIGDICLRLEPNEVYGFFAGDPSYSATGSKYRYFFTAGLRKALQNGLEARRAGCFYRSEGRGVSAILQALGECFRDFASTEFRSDYPGRASTAGLSYGGVQIGYSEIGESRDW